MTFQPYQQAEEELLRREQAPVKHFKRAASIGAAAFTGGLGGSAILNRLLPLLSEHIPANLAKKGIEKISPQLGKFVESATNLGHDFYDVRDFLRAKAAEEQDQKEEKKSNKLAEQRNVIQQYSPELDQYISGEIQKGRSPLEAGALASMQNNFKPIIKKMTEDHKTPFSSILQSIYGGQEQNQPTNVQPEQSATGGIDKSQILGNMQRITQLLQGMTGRGNG